MRVAEYVMVRSSAIKRIGADSQLFCHIFSVNILFRFVGAIDMVNCFNFFFATFNMFVVPFPSECRSFIFNYVRGTNSL